MLDRTNEGTYLRIFNSCYFVNVPEIRSILSKREKGVFPGYRPTGGLDNKSEWKNFTRSKQMGLGKSDSIHFSRTRLR